MDSIIVKVSDLHAKINELSADKMQFVELSFMEEDGDLPACISFHAIDSPTSFSTIDYEEVNAVDDVEFPDTLTRL